MLGHSSEAKGLFTHQRKEGQGPEKAEGGDSWASQDGQALVPTAPSTGPASLRSC